MDFGGFVGFIIIYWVLMLVLTFLAAGKMKKLVDDKGYNSRELHVFAWCFWFPIFGYLYAIALPDLNLHKQNEEITACVKNDETADDNCWICKKCGLKNPKTRMTCQKCDTYKNAHL